MLITEYEAKWDIDDLHAFKQKLILVGAQCVFPERLLKRVNFDLPGKVLAEKGGWVRLRDEGAGYVSLTYKQNDKKLTIESIKEIEVSVSDYETTKKLLLACTMYQKCEEETRRERWQLRDVHIDIDTWPWLPPFVEIEGKTEVDVFAVAHELGLPRESARFGPVTDKYMSVYEINVRSEVGHADKYFSAPCPWQARITPYDPTKVISDVSA